MAANSENTDYGVGVQTDIDPGSQGDTAILTIAHISDLHFNGTEYNNRRVRAVLDYINERSTEIDVLLVTGDIADSGHPSQYEEAAQTLWSPLPMLICPGNHDARDEFGFGLLGKHSHDDPLNRAQLISGALFISVDSSVRGQPYGHLSDHTLAWMEAQIDAQPPTTPVFVSFHHPPVRLRMPFMDHIRMADNEGLEQLVTNHPNIAAMFCGHAHTGAVTTFAGRPLCLAPGVASTLNLPFEGAEVINPTQPPGLAFHTYADGRLVSHFRSVPVG